MKKLTMFSWGYWGWGSTVKEFVKGVDAVERSRGFLPPVFVDVRISRSVRAAGFRDQAFAKIVGASRYRWMPGLGNKAITDRSLDKITIANPREAVDLLDFALENAKKRRKVIFFCSCEVPRECHRHLVGGLLLKEAKKRGVALEIIEWPGGEAEVIREKVSKETFNQLAKGKNILPLSPRPKLAKYCSVAWGSPVEIVYEDVQLFFLSGPAVYRAGRWGLPVFTNLLDELDPMMKGAPVLRRALGCGARSNKASSG